MADNEALVHDVDADLIHDLPQNEQNNANAASADAAATAAANPRTRAAAENAAVTPIANPSDQQDVFQTALVKQPAPRREILDKDALASHPIIRLASDEVDDPALGHPYDGEPTVRTIIPALASLDPAVFIGRLADIFFKAGGKKFDEEVISAVKGLLVDAPDVEHLHKVGRVFRVQTQLKRNQSPVEYADAHRDILRYFYSRMIVAHSTEPPTNSAATKPTTPVPSTLLRRIFGIPESAQRQSASTGFDNALKQDPQLRPALEARAAQVRFQAPAANSGTRLPLQPQHQDPASDQQDPPANSTPSKTDDRTKQLKSCHQTIITSLMLTLRPAEEVVLGEADLTRRELEALIKKLASHIMTAEKDMKRIVTELQDKSALEDELNSSRHRVSRQYARILGELKHQLNLKEISTVLDDTLDSTTAPPTRRHTAAATDLQRSSPAKRTRRANSASRVDSFTAAVDSGAVGAAMGALSDKELKQLHFLRNFLTGSGDFKQTDGRSHSHVTGQATLHAPDPTPKHGPAAVWDVKFFRKLPDIWSIVPHPDEVTPCDFMKMITSKTLLKFSGEEGDYELFRNMFVPCVHRQPAHTNLKAIALLYCLEDVVPDAKAMIYSTGSSLVHGYIDVIKYLERHFGGKERITHNKWKLVRTCVVRDPTNAKEIETLLRTLKSYRTTLKAAGNATHFCTNDVLREVLANLPRTMENDFWLWTARTHPGAKVDTDLLLHWLDELDNALAQTKQTAPGAVATHPTTSPLNLDELEHNVLFAGTGQQRQQHRQQPQQQRPQHASKKPGTQTRQDECECCGARSHFRFVECEKYKAMSPDDRVTFIQTAGKCFRCLGNHFSRNCTKTGSCKECDGRHHHTLHGGTMPTKARTEQPKHAFHARDGGRAADTDAQFSLRTLPVLLFNPASGIRLRVNALLDEGSDATILSTEAAAKLKVKSAVDTSKVFRFMGVGGVVTQHAALTTNLTLQSTTGDFAAEISASVIPAPAGSLVPVDWSSLKRHFTQLADLPLEPPAPGGVDLIIGVDCRSVHRCVKEIHTSGPDARLTAVGWTVAGPLNPGTETDPRKERHVHKIQRVREGVETQLESLAKIITDSGGKQGYEVLLRENQELTNLLQRSWQAERPKAVRGSYDSEINVRLLQRMRDSVTREDGRYTMPVLWKENEPTFTSNRLQAVKSLDSLLSGQLKVPELRTQYGAVINDYLDAGTLVHVPPDKLQDPHRYLTHFAVSKASDPSKVRPVMNAACKFHGKSLNDAIHPGPNLANDLAEVLVRFRRYSVAVCGDIRNMFHQIALPLEDQPFHRILWRSDQGQLLDLQFTCQVFGVACSPSSSMFCTRDLAEIHADSHPAAAKAGRESIMTDDITTSVPTIEEALRLVEELKAMYASAHMEIRKWGSSESAVLNSVPAADRAKTLEMNSLGGRDQATGIMALGLRWIMDKDTLTYRAPTHGSADWTPKRILSHFLKIFDPLGLLCPFIVSARIAFQELWLRYRVWDIKIPPVELVTWQEWLDSLPQLDDLSFPRCLQLKHAEAAVVSTQLHVFSDASEKAYGVAAYVRTTYQDESVHVALAKATARVAPAASHTIPRLELMAAHTAIQFLPSVADVLQIPRPAVFFWVDSKVVLAWIHTMSKCLKAFVGNRVHQIHEETSPAQWSYVNTAQNPADLASRGATPTQLQDSDLWKHGPRFLRLPASQWPRPTPVEADEAVLREVKKDRTYGVLAVSDDGLVRCLAGRRIVAAVPVDKYSGTPSFAPHPATHSCYATLVRVVAVALKWLANSKKTGNNKSMMLSAADYRRGEVRLWKLVQEEGLQGTRHQLKQDGQVGARSWLLRARPQLDEDDLVRECARLRTALHLPYEMRCPVILPPDHPVVLVLLVHVHKVKLLHAGGAVALVAAFRRKFHTSGLITKARKIVATCVQCKTVNATPNPPQMAPLPDDRIAPSEARVAPFNSVGVDACGPFHVKTKSGQAEKSYVVIFTCALYRAVHLEVVDSLSTDAFLLAFTRFVALRNRPTIVRSDNGAQFVAADRELASLWPQLRQQKFKKAFPDIEWKFNVPRAPHTGGFFERLIQSFKRSLYATVRQPLTLEEFRTVVAEIQGALNNRPITKPDPTDPLSAEALTPNHFVSGTAFEPLAALPYGVQATTKQRWRFILDLLDKNWQRFIAEFLPHFHALNKWGRDTPKLQVNDLVVCLQAKDRGRFPIARVTAVENGGRDNAPRRVTIQYQGRLYQRAPHVLLRLEPLIIHHANGTEATPSEQ